VFFFSSKFKPEPTPAIALW